MADPKGFLKVTERELPKRRPVPVRIMDWKEVYEAGDQAVLKRQAGRCMDCGVPSVSYTHLTLPTNREV